MPLFMCYEIFMKTYSAPVIIFLMLFLPSICFANCSANVNSCSFYQCKEKEQSCGASGYWLNFGYRYCQIFLNTEKSFSSPGQKWLDKVRVCLQTRANKISQVQSCQNIRKVALDSHVGCYIDTGFCSLSFKDKSQIYWYLKDAIFDRQSIREAEELNAICFEKQFKSPNEKTHYL